MSVKKSRIAEQGFTLVELSIVIVIIGFLVAGIAAGTNMIKQAELRSVITDLQSYQTAYNNFIGRFSKVPGDMNTSSSFWPTCAETAGNCNGDGDGVIDFATSVGDGSGDEVFAAWRQLALGGMISAGIIQIPNTYNGTLTVGDKAPSSKITGAGYFMAGGSNIGSGLASPWTDNQTNAVFIGKPESGSTLTTGALTAEESFNLDQKLDDAIVDTNDDFIGNSTGNVRAIQSSVGTNTCIDASGNYAVGQAAADCLLGIALN